MASEIGDLASQTLHTVDNINGIVGEVNKAVSNMTDCIITVMGFLEGTVLGDYELFSKSGEQYLSDADDFKQVMGQKQRSSIARALMKDAPILILDDALSAVDTDTEERILHNLKQTREGKTTILIAHRISTIQNADIILVLEDGEAKEIGNHNQLMLQNGIYREMYEKQQLEAAKGELVE